MDRIDGKPDRRDQARPPDDICSLFAADNVLFPVAARDRNCAPKRRAICLRDKAFRAGPFK
jgi:hypothetical protein